MEEYYKFADDKCFQTPQIEQGSEWDVNSSAFEDVQLARP